MKGCETDFITKRDLSFWKRNNWWTHVIACSNCVVHRNASFTANLDTSNTFGYHKIQFITMYFKYQLQKLGQGSIFHDQFLWFQHNGKQWILWFSIFRSSFSNGAYGLGHLVKAVIIYWPDFSCKLGNYCILRGMVRMWSGLLPQYQPFVQFLDLIRFPLL